MLSAIRSLALLTLTGVGSTTTSWSLQADPPARIARASYLTGSVSFRPGGLDGWVPATSSYPLSTGAELWSDNNARAEVHIGGSAIWLGAQTLVDFRNVADHETQLRLAQGGLYLRIPRLGSSDSYEIDTPTGAVSLLQDGTYRIDVAPDGRRSTITVRHGRAEVSTGGGTMQLRSGESVVIADANAPLTAATVTVTADDWEQWAESRDLVEDHSVALRYLSPDVVGFEALDGYGTWQIDANFGPVWVPEVPAGWAPYRYGSWTWIDPWGWTWIDDARWGFAPSHYGRWAFLENEWAWVPGEIVAEPVYAPALVGFLGGSDFELSLSLSRAGAVAWFPLAPGEIYIPPFRVSEDYVREINRSAVKITEVDFSKVDPARISYRYRSLPGAVTTVSKETFVTGAPVSKAVLRVPAGALAKATVVGTTAPITRNKQDMLPVGMARSAPRPPAAALQRQVVTKRNARPGLSPGSATQPARSGIPTTRSGGNISAKSSDRSSEQQSRMERERLLARQAAERAELEGRQRSELTTIQSPDVRQQLQQRHTQEQADLGRRHQAELQSFDRKRPS